MELSMSSKQKAILQHWHMSHLCHDAFSVIKGKVHHAVLDSARWRAASSVNSGLGDTIDKLGI